MPNLLLFMTPGVGLSAWKKIGTLERELKPYILLAQSGWNIKILTFDQVAVPDLPDEIETVRFPHRRWLWSLPWLHKKLGSWADLLKTNQTSGCYYYVWAAGKWKTPILLRGGYVQGEFYETTRGTTPKVSLYQRLERWAYQNATHCQVTTQPLAEWVQKKYDVPPDRMTVIPNHVDTDLFQPGPNIQKQPNSVVAVGRLDKVKQLDLLLRACSKIPDCRLTLIGEGSEKQNLMSLAKELGIPLDLPGNLPHEDLPGMISKHRVYAITSSREGHSKSLIEAMACGMPSVVTNVPGLRTAVRDGVDGILAEPDERSIREAITRLFDDPVLCTSLGKEARAVIIKNYSQEKILHREKELLTSLLTG